MNQGLLFEETNDVFPENETSIGTNLSIQFSEKNKEIVSLYFKGILIERANFLDRVEKRLFVVECVERDAIKARLAEALNISRQTIHNYIETKKHFGLEGLINNYSPSKSKNLRKQRELNKNKLLDGNKSEQLAEIRLKEKQERESQQLSLFDFEIKKDILKVEEEKDEPYSEIHPWTATRYAGIFTYIPTLISKWRWLFLIIGLFGGAYKIFMIFILMAARNIRSIEQLKNARFREAGIVLGIKNIGSA